MNRVMLLLLTLPLLIAGMGRALRLDTRVPPRSLSLSESRVSIVRWADVPSDAQVETMVREALGLALGPGGIGQVVASGDTVVLKPNLGLGLDAHETTSWPVARAVALACQEAGASRVIIGESPERGLDHYRQAGYTTHIQGVEYIDFSAPTTSLLSVLVEDTLWPEGERLIMPRVYVEADVVISLPKMKTHNTAGTTGALKNAVGVPPLSAYSSSPDLGWRDRFHRHYGIHKTIPQINLARPPDLVVMDAILAGEGTGPWGADPVQTNMILVSRDPVALDAVATTIMGFEPERIRHLAYAAHKGLGQLDLEHIEIVGEELSAVRRDFSPPGRTTTLFRKATVIGSPPSGWVLDGDLDEWQTLLYMPVDHLNQVQVGVTDWDGEADSSLCAWAAYDDEHLYLAARVRDDLLIPNNSTPSSLWDGDAVELYFSGADQDQPGRGANYQADDFRLGVGYGQTTVYDIGRGTPLVGAAVATQDLADGYALEMRVPFAALYGFAPSLNREIGLDLALDDADGTVGRES